MADILTSNLSHVSAPALVLSLALLVVQHGAGGVASPRVRPDNQQPPELREMLHHGNAFFRSGEYLRAIQIYDSGYKEAKRRGSMQSAVRFLNNLGSAHYEMFRYRDAIQAYLEARDLAIVQGNQETLVALCFNLSSLYFRMGDVEASRASAEQGLKLPGKASAKFKARLLIQYARIRRQQKESGPAVALLKDAIDASRLERDAGSEAQAWEALGNTFIEQGRLSDAERALVEGLRLRESTHDDHIYYSYESLGNLRKLQGDLPSAAALFDKAVDSAGTVGLSAMWQAYYERGKVKLAQVRLDEAFADFGAALQSARQWRAEVLPADAFRIGAEVELHEVYSSFIELGSRLYAQTGRTRLVEQTFAAAEESRAESLRALWAGRDLTKALPGEYWEALADLNKLESGLVNGKPAVEMVGVRRLRQKVDEMEALAALDLPRNRGNPEPVDSGLLERTRRTLRPTEAYLGFHVGEAESCLWVIARDGFEFHRLPPGASLAGSVGLLVKAVRDNSREAVSLGNQLYSRILGSSRILAEKPTWILAPDGPLFELPFAALVQEVHSPGDTPLYVVERHALQIVPGVSTLFPTAAPDLDGPVIGVGDPIYNRADPRLPHPKSSTRAPAMELARLVGSGREIENCDRIWRSCGYEPILLQGEAANRTNLMAALQRKPAVLHLAAHVLFPGQDSSPGLVALSLTPAGELELLSANEISGMRLTLGLVVLNGCSSGHAAILPGAGLMGMTRAWLAAGARAVIVTRWATADQNEGELFQSFYHRFSSHPDLDPAHRKSFAQSLQEAQIAELRAGGRRANPANWAAYFCVERN
jgi:CHAT domain-containing protein/tetratricopeptide (TPR) repeat protein